MFLLWVTATADDYSSLVGWLVHERTDLPTQTLSHRENWEQTQESSVTN